MTQQEYEQKRHDDKELYLSKFVVKEHLDTYEHEVFDFAFARGYALGKQEKGEDKTKPYGVMEARRKSDGEIIEVKEWRGASDVIYSSPDMSRFYQESDLDFNVDAETTVISGLVLADEISSARILRVHKVAQGDYEAVWNSGEPEFCLGEELFCDLTPGSDPIEVEILIRRKQQ